MGSKPVTARDGKDSAGLSWSRLGDGGILTVDRGKQGMGLRICRFLFIALLCMTIKRWGIIIISMGGGIVGGGIRVGGAMCGAFFGGGNCYANPVITSSRY
jgi:hypothetical protein